MLVSGLTEFGLLHIVDKLSDMYDGNIIVKDEITRKTRNTCSVALRANVSGGKGARRSPSGRRGPWACWHVFRDFSRLVFEMNPDARINAKYTSENFEDTYPETDYVVYGDYYWSDLCDCGGMHGE